MGDGIRLRHRRSGDETVHVWYKYEQIVTYGYKEQEIATEDLTIYPGETLYQSSDRNGSPSEVTFDKTTGLYTFTNESKVYPWETIVEIDASADDTVLRRGGTWRGKSPHPTNKIYLDCDSVFSATTATNPKYQYYQPEKVRQGVIDTSNVLNRSKGNYIEQVKSNNGSAYPQNSHQNGYWYVYSHSYKK